MRGLPSDPSAVALFPAFDSWAAPQDERRHPPTAAEDDVGRDESATLVRALRATRLRPELPVAARKAQAVWRGARTGGDPRSSLRGRVVDYCQGKPWADVRFVDDAHARGMPRGMQGVTGRGELRREEQAGYQVLLLIDGHTWASAWEWALASGSVCVYLGVWAFHATCALEAWVHEDGAVEIA